MSIIKRPDSPYYWYKFQINGIVYRGSTNRKSMRDAKIVYEAKRAEVKRNAPAKATRGLLSEFMEQYLALHKVQGTNAAVTIKEKRRTFTRFLTVLKDKPPHEYTSADNILYLTSMQHLAKNSVAVHSRRIVALFNWLKSEDVVKKNPFTRVSEEPKGVKDISPEQIEQILKYSEANRSKFTPLLRFLILTAFRINEALTLTTKNIDYENGYIHIRGKGDKPATIPLLTPVRELLQGLEPDSKGKYFPFTKDALYRLFQRIRAVTGITVTAHDFRKYSLTQMANSGANVYFLMKYARHSDIKTTLKYYLRTDLEKMRDELEPRLPKA